MGNFAANCIFRMHVRLLKQNIFFSMDCHILAKELHKCIVNVEKNPSYEALFVVKKKRKQKQNLHNKILTDAHTRFCFIHSHTSVVHLYGCCCSLENSKQKVNKVSKEALQKRFDK